MCLVKEKKIETGTSAIETDGVDGNTAIGRINSHIPRTTIEGNLCDKGVSFQRNSGAASVVSITRQFGFINWVDNVPP